MNRVAVAVATYQRTELLPGLLRSLSELRTREPFDVVVVDNDPAGSALPVLEELRSGLPYRLMVVHESEPGISAARNAALDAVANHDLIAFIDDDEVAEQDWLQGLLDAKRRHGCAGVTGPVVYDHEVPPPPWALLGGFYTAPRFPEGASVPMAGTNNLLLDLATLRRLALRFDPAFGLVGGSDIVLTRALTDAGETIVWALGARVRETVPATRCRPRWLVRRAVRFGNSYALMQLTREHHLVGRCRVRAVLALTGLLRVGRGAAGLVLHPRINSEADGARALRTLLRGLGVLAAASGFRVAEYARTEVKDG
jgi:succinoglycan biosynthesis protein ExoM